MTIQINDEDKWLHAFALGPGWVHTDLGDYGAAKFSVDEATMKAMMIDQDTSCDGMMEVLSKTTKAEHGGKLVGYDGSIVSW